MIETERGRKSWRQRGEKREGERMREKALIFNVSVSRYKNTTP